MYRCGLTRRSPRSWTPGWRSWSPPIPTTIRGHRDKVRRWKAALGAKKVSRLTAQDLDRTYSRWLDEGAAPQTVQHCHRVLATALKQAQQWGLISRCVTDLARPPASVHRVLPELDPAAWQGPGAGSKGEGARYGHGRPAASCACCGGRTSTRAEVS
jgi:hypothetical protein